ncbi:hypothetical protein DSO57_1034651 [Entomophthora muscae]|uniref:Uncharacterized protein n=1 Tax=Entomophthora muscae TaxID=34485 RepID=A0ACC2SCF9_9FUNG|nr:hypothetical protein DSO57_1034651 [Entomophthora muscae]
MQAKYKLLTNHSSLLENNNSSKPVPGYNPGHTLGTDDQEPHKSPTQGSFSSSVGGVGEHLDKEMLKGDCIMISKMAPFNGRGSEAENFLREFKNQSKLMLWPEKLCWFSMLMGPEASQWFEQTNWTSWKEVEQSFQDEFEERVISSEAYSKVCLLKQGQAETL